MRKGFCVRCSGCMFHPCGLGFNVFAMCQSTAIPDRSLKQIKDPVFNQFRCSDVK